MFTLLISAALATTPPVPESALNTTDRDLRVRLSAEVGMVGALSHVIQYGKDGTEFDYKEEGGQDVLFPFKRMSADLDLGARHTVVFLYQPIDLRTNVTLQEDQVFDSVAMPAGTPVDIRYGFDFYRGSWMYDLQADPTRELSLGASLQLRDAVLDFTSADGTLRSSNRDVGPVPLLKLRVRQPLGEGLWWGAEVDGVWAPIKYLNGSDSDVEGALLDASLRAGMHLGHGVDTFLNLRYLGGGAEGTGSNTTPPGDGYTRNWLQFTSVSLGFALR